jgi:hydroxymethylbilane synthase
MSHDAHRIVIGSHRSSVAQAGAHWTGRELRRQHPQAKIEYAVVSESTSATTFVREVEQALARGAIDLAVLSGSDLLRGWSTKSVLVAVPTREMPFDVLVAEDGVGLEDIPRGAKIGAHGPHRRAQILAQRRDLVIVDTGPDPTVGLAAMQRGEMEGLVVAGSDLEWLGLADRVSEILMTSICLPAPGQGAIAVRARERDPRAHDLAASIDDPVARAAALAECACGRVLGPSGEILLGAYCEATDGDLNVEGLLISEDGRRVVRDSEEGGLDEAEALGAALGRRLLDAGRDGILRTSSARAAG